MMNHPYVNLVGARQGPYVDPDTLDVKFYDAAGKVITPSEYWYATRAGKKAEEQFPEGEAKLQGRLSDPDHDWTTGRYEWSEYKDAKIPKVGDGPKTPTYDTTGKAGKNGVSVNTDALRVFVKNMESLKNSVETAKEKLFVVPPDGLKPGQFGHAFKLWQSVDGDMGIRPELNKLLNRVIDTFGQVIVNMNSLIENYDGTEDMNEMTAQQVQNEMSRAADAIHSLGDFGKNSSDGMATTAEQGSDSETAPKKSSDKDKDK